MLKLLVALVVSSSFLTVANAVEIVVHGSAEQAQFADEWQVNFKLFIQKSSKKAAIDAYNEAKPQVERLLSNPDNTEKIDSNFSSQPWVEWVKEKEVLRGWEIEHSYTVRYKSQDQGTDDLGALSVIKYVVIEGVTPLLQKATRLKLRDQVLADAFAVAYGKALILAKSASVHVKKVVQILENNVGDEGRYGDGRYASVMPFAKAGTGARRAVFTLDPNKISVTQSVDLKVETD